MELLDYLVLNKKKPSEVLDQLRNVTVLVLADLEGLVVTTEVIAVAQVSVLTMANVCHGKQMRMGLNFY